MRSPGPVLDATFPRSLKRRARNIVLRERARDTNTQDNYDRFRQQIRRPVNSRPEACKSLAWETALDLGVLRGGADQRRSPAAAPNGAPGRRAGPARLAVLRWRQDHLPTGQPHRRWDTDALIHLERDAVWRLSDRLGLDDDQRFSLMRHHKVAVDETVRRARADVARPGGEMAHAELSALAFRRVRRRRRFPLLRFTIGWGVWLSNRRVQIWDRWFRLRTLDAYRGTPQP
jgi:hypothetical protein